MNIGPWYDPIERRWQFPRPPVVPTITTVHETATEKGYRIAKYNRIWEAVQSTARSSQQVDNQAD